MTTPNDSQNSPLAGNKEQLYSLSIDAARKLPKPSKVATFFWVCGGIIIGLIVSVFLHNMAEANRIAEEKAEKEKKAITDAAANQSLTKNLGDVILTATGYVTPRRRIALSPQVSGIVTSADIEKGDIVKKDQVLVRLQDNEYKARLDQAIASEAAAKARLDLLIAGTRKEDIDQARATVAQVQAQLIQFEKTLERLKRLNLNSEVETQQRMDEAVANRDASKAQLDASKATLAALEAGPRKEDIEAARADYEAAKANVEINRIQLDYTIIKAPSDGTILEKLIEVGVLVTPQNFGGTRGAQSELLSLADLGDLQVEVDVSESDFNKIQMKNPAKVYLDAYPETGYDAFIREIAPGANREKATIQVKVSITNPDKFVRPEMSARVDFLKTE